MIHLKQTHVRTGYLFVLLILLTQSLVAGFYTSTTISILQGRTPNITCWMDMNMDETSTILLTFFGIPFIYPMASYGDACVFIKQNGNLLNGSQFYTFFAGSILETNLYRQMTRRCGANFSPTNTFIGYGRCTSFPYETWTTDLCICSTNYCNQNYSTCMASVQATTSQPPPNLAIFVPELSNIISCYTSSYGSTYSYVYNDSLRINQVGAPIDMTTYRTYYSTHAVACMLIINENNGDWAQSTFIYEQYEGQFYTWLLMNASGYLYNFYQSATSVVAKLQYYYATDSFSSYNATICYCTTNNCNLNLATCTAGGNNNSSSPTAASTTSYSNTTTSSSTSTVTTSTAKKNGCLKQTSLTIDQRFQNFFLLIFIIILHKTI